jgi:energy-coupling factor transport system ATP-binding protein
MALKLTAVSASYPIDQQRMVLHDVTLVVRDSGCLALVGPSGSGKSTIGRLMNGLHKPAAGTVELDGKNLQELDTIAEARRRVGLLMQQPDNQLFGMTVGEDIRFGPELAGIDLATSMHRLETAMEMVGLNKEQFASRSPFSLSGGERRRVALAGLLAMQPRHLVLDEPAAGLDPAGRESIEHVISDTATRIGVVLLTADLPLALRLADRVVLLDAGRVVFDGAPGGAVADRDLLKRLRLLAPVEADVLDALKSRGAPIEPVADMRPDSVLAAILAALREAPRVASSAGRQDAPC